MKSIYIHIPFCKQKCLYCDFNSYCGKEELVDSYIDALKKEIKSYNLSFFNTIYFGGGTPSFIDERYIGEILNLLEFDDSTEITLEVNPGTVSKEKFEAYRNFGINRISIGLQATQDSILKEIGRIHSFSDFESTYNLARECGFNNISVDLMFGLPNQTLDDLKESLEHIIFKNPEHISCYSLILHDDIFDNLPDDVVEREMYYYIVSRLREAGYFQYEISNFAKKGFESRHNLCYWNQDEYIGVGAGASSYVNGVRFKNVSEIEKYILNNKREIEEVQGFDDKLNEYMILRLRLLEGVSIERFKERFNIDVLEKFKDKLERLVKTGLLEISDTNIRLTNKGLDFANIVWEEFV